MSQNQETDQQASEISEATQAARRFMQLAMIASRRQREEDDEVLRSLRQTVEGALAQSASSRREDWVVAIRDALRSLTQRACVEDASVPEEDTDKEPAVLAR
jgi:ribosomal protein RSM22 (predicted rRNA methylase)